MNERVPQAIPGCLHPARCPLSQVRAGSAVRIKELAAAPDINVRLREMGLFEDQQLKLLIQDRCVVCQVCNVRLGLSQKLADSIWVEPVLV